MGISEQLINDKKGKAVAVLIPVSQYRKIKERLEELEEIKAFDKAMKRKPHYTAFDEAVKKIRSKRKRRA
ncbi:MAG: hypothetical protein HC867_00525 [Bacteroidia bacterium]|nr:hypothetical protein [Bacteroidia bacterium]